MSSDWPMVRLGNHCEKIGSGATPKGGKSVYLDLGETALIRSQNVYNEGFTASGLAFISEEAADKLKNVSIESNDILLNITGDSVARVCMAPEEYLPARVNQHVAIIRPDNSRLDSRFVRYFLSSPEQQRSLLTIASSGATRNALTKSHIEQLEVPMPGLEIQQAIANQLETLDKKIKLNHQINQTLEQMAQAIFKSWFVDFEPVKAKMAALEAGGSKEDALIAAMQAISGQDQAQLARFETEQPEQYNELRTTAELFPSAMQDSELGEIPEGWSVEPFSNIAILDTTSVKPWLKPETKWEHYSIPAYDSYSAPIFEDGIEIKSNKYKVHPSAILSSKLNPHFPRTWIPEISCAETAICSTEFMQFVPKKLEYRYFIAALVTSIPFQQGLMMRVTGSTGSRQRAQPKQVMEMEVTLAPEELRSMFSKRVSGIYLQQAFNIKENQSLGLIRDTLLPKLLSGEVAAVKTEQEMESCS